MNEDGKIRIRYVYDFNGYEAEWELEKEVELFKFKISMDFSNIHAHDRVSSIISSYGVAFLFSGTDIKNESIMYIYSDNEDYYSTKLTYNAGESRYILGIYSSIPYEYTFSGNYDWSIYQIQKVEKTKIYVQYGSNLYQIVIDLDYNIILELVK